MAMVCAACRKPRARSVNFSMSICVPLQSGQAEPTPIWAAGTPLSPSHVVCVLDLLQGAAMRIETIYRYPVKGLTAEAMEDVLLTAGETLPHDRRFALAQGDSAFDPAAPSWLPKRNFACLMVNARLALAHSAFDARTGELAI